MRMRPFHPSSPWKRHWGLILLPLVAATLHAAPPRLDSFQPTQGPAGTPVRLSGEGFEETTDVLIGTQPAIYQVLSDSLILATVPREASTGSIQIVTRSGIAVSSDPFVGAPFIEELNPEFGAPNEPITIHGRNLQNATAVHFGDLRADFTVLGDTQLSARVPNTTGLKTIIVTTPVGKSESETAFEATGRVPFVREFQPELAPPGKTVTVNGKNFLGTSSFHFGSVPASFVVTADTQIQLEIPPMAESGPVTLRNAAGESTSRVNFLVIGTTPYVEEIKPDVASPGESITLEGLNFTGTTAILFGEAVSTFTVTADTQVQVTVPEGAVSGPLQLESANGRSQSTVPFTLNSPAPHIEDFEPLAVRGGELLRINGRNFSTVSSVLIGEINAEFDVVADNQISVTTPTDPLTARITLSNPGGITSSTNHLVITGPEPRIAELNPNAGQPGDLIVIEGGNLATTTNVWFGTMQAEYSILADNQLQAVVPNSATTAPISVENPGGRATSLDSFFLPVQINGFSPTIAVPGQTIEVSGENFTGSSEIQFGTVIGSIESIEPHRLVATVPVDARIGPLAITNPAGIVGTQQTLGIQPELETFSPPAAPVGANVTVTGKGFTEVSDVRIGTTPAPFELRTAKELVIRIPINAPSGPITIINPSASSTSAEHLTIVESADLTLNSEIPLSALEWQVPYQFRITIANGGPSTVANARLTVQLPPGSVMQSQSNSHGGCEVVDDVATCNLVNVAASEQVTIEFSISPSYYGTFTMQSILTTPLLDPTPNDHESTLAVTVSGPIPRPTFERSEDSRLITWPKAAADYVIQQANELQAPIVWNAIGGPFLDLSDRWGLTLPSHAGQGFYRLQLRETDPIFLPTE